MLNNREKIFESRSEKRRMEQCWEIFFWVCVMNGAMYHYFSLIEKFLKFRVQPKFSHNEQFVRNGVNFIKFFHGSMGNEVEEQKNLTFKFKNFEESLQHNFHIIVNLFANKFK